MAVVVVASTWLHFYRAKRGRKYPSCRWNFHAICHISRDIIISGFGGHVAISGCRLLLLTLFFELHMVVNPQFSDRISMLPDIVSEICFSGFGGHFPLAGHYWNPPGTPSLCSPSSKTYRLAVVILTISLRDISTSGLKATLLFPVVRRLRNYCI